MPFNQGLTPTLKPCAGGTVNPTDPSTTRKIVEECLCDDTLSDGGSVLVPYVNTYLVEVDDADVLTSTPLGTFTDSTLKTPYAVVGTPIACDSIGDYVLGVRALRTHITTAQTFELPSTLIQSVTLIVRAIGNPFNPPTLTDAHGTTPLFLGSESWDVSSSSYVIRDTFTLTTNPGDVVTVLMTELTTT